MSWLNPWLNQFSAYSLIHILILTLAIAMVIKIYKEKNHALSKKTESRIPWYVLGFFIFHFLYYWFIRGFHAGFDIPVLQLCGTLGVTLSLYIFTRKPIFYHITYLFGFTAMTLSFFIPDLENGPSHEYFWFYWVPHFLILNGITRLTLAYKQPITLPDLHLALLSFLAYAMLVIVPLNAWLKKVTGYSNYLYLQESPFPLFGWQPEPPYYYPILASVVYFLCRIALWLHNRYVSIYK